MLPGRLPKIDNCNWKARVPPDKWKFRPTFLAMMGAEIGVEPFADPRECENEIDRFGENASQQNYSTKLYVCPTVSDWTDERNAAYGYNYQFLGNSRLQNPSIPISFKRWPVFIVSVARPSECVAIGDSMGTAASFARGARGDYLNNARDDSRLGNEGFNLDPPRIAPANGESATYPTLRTSVADRHRGKANILWVDGHATPESPEALGYEIAPDGKVGMNGSNARWSTNGKDVAWTIRYFQ
jgi:prepilin-type processing-associated H-X9-DG protein